MLVHKQMGETVMLIVSPIIKSNGHFVYISMRITPT